MKRCILALLAIISIVGCASKSQSYFASDRKVALPDSAKVKAVLSVSQENKREKLSAVLFAVPNERYRLELSGTFGFSAASILWKRDGWKIIFPQDERYMEGNGDCIYIPIYGGVDIHKFAILFFGHRVNTLACGDFGEDLFLEYIDNSATAFFGSDSLKIEIKNIDKRAKWQGGVWNLNVPESYVNVRY